MSGVKPTVRPHIGDYFGAMRQFVELQREHQSYFMIADYYALNTTQSRASDASKANIMGTGLGLYVAKELVKANGGKVWAESPGEGKGSTFVVELPAV